MPNPGAQSQPIPTVLIIEDGDEYFEFFDRHLFGYRLLQSHSFAEAKEAFRQNTIDIIVLDIRFDRTPREQLIGDVEAVSRSRFGQTGDLGEAWRYLADNQGFLIAQRLRDEGHREPFMIIESLPQRQIENLRRLYGAVTVVPEFDVKQIHAALLELLRTQ
jgi:CheY-like chemotaxis protein